MRKKSIRIKKNNKILKEEKNEKQKWKLENWKLIYGNKYLKLSFQFFASVVK